MISSARVVVVRPAVRVASVRTALPRSRVARFSTTTAARAEQAASSSSSSSGAANQTNLFAAAAGGGGVVLLGGIIAYQFSDVKAYIKTANQAKAYAQQTKDKMISAVSNSTSQETLASLRGLVKSYSGLIPGAGSYVDATFDDLDRIAERHGDDAKKIVDKAYDEVRSIVTNGQVDVNTATTLASALTKYIGQLQQLGKEAANDVLDNHPDFKEKLGGGYDRLVKLAEEKGPEAQQALEDVRKQLQEIYKSGVSVESLNKARKLVQDKTEELRNTLEPAAKDAWNASLKKAEPYLDKVPEIRKLLESNVAVLAAPGAKDVFDRVKRVAEAKGDEQKRQLDAFKQYVEERVREAGDNLPIGWDDVIGYIKSVPGGEALLKKVPNVEAFAELSKHRGKDAVNLTRETWDEVLEVLSKKAEKAKELSQGVKEDAKKQAQK